MDWQRNESRRNDDRRDATIVAEQQGYRDGGGFGAATIETFERPGGGYYDAAVVRDGAGNTRTVPIAGSDRHDY